jgi:hypothetical protein
MLHALLKQAGHPRAQFLEACAPIVSCQGACITDAGPWRPPTSDYALLPSDSLEVTSVATLLSPESDGQSWVALEIFVHNPRGAVLVASTVKSETPDTFAADVRGPEGGVGVVDVARDSSTLFFLPNETKRRLFEFRVASDLTPNHIPTGTHLIRGGYARVWAPYDTVIVSP